MLPVKTQTVNRTDTDQKRQKEICVGISQAVDLHGYGTSRASCVLKLVQSAACEQ